MFKMISRMITKDRNLETVKKLIDIKLEKVGVIISELSKMTDKQYNKLAKERFLEIKELIKDVNIIKRKCGISNKKQIGNYITDKTIKVLDEQFNKLDINEQSKMRRILNIIREM